MALPLHNSATTKACARCARAQGACRSFAFASGMAALSAMLRLAAAGDHVVAGDDLYGGTSRLLAQVAPNLGIEVTHVDTARPECALSRPSFRALVVSCSSSCTACQQASLLCCGCCYATAAVTWRAARVAQHHTHVAWRLPWRHLTLDTGGGVVQ